jgi:hypothetical protein
MTFRDVAECVLHAVSGTRDSGTRNSDARTAEVREAQRAVQQDLRRAALQDEARLRQSTQGAFGPGGGM